MKSEFNIVIPKNKMLIQKKSEEKDEMRQSEKKNRK